MWSREQDTSASRVWVKDLYLIRILIAENFGMINFIYLFILRIAFTFHSCKFCCCKVNCKINKKERKNKQKKGRILYDIIYLTDS